MTAAQEQSEGWASRAMKRARRPHKEHMEALRLCVPYPFIVAVLVAFASFQIWMNPFGFSDLVQRYAQDVSDLLITGPYFYGTEGRDNVSVALIDEDTLHQLNSPWPWKYGDHARVLDALLQYKPKAVVIDFLFVNSRPDDTLKDLVAEIGRYRKAHVPLYFEGGINLPYGENPLRPELAATGVPIIDPSVPINSGVARQYYGTARCFNQTPDGAGNCPSLAMRVFHDVYGNKYPQPHINDMMELVWGTRTAPENHWITRTDETGNQRSCGEQMNVFRRWYLAFFNTSAVKSPCPYTAQLPVEALSLHPDDKDVAKMATNRVIFYGGALEGAQDKLYTPVNALLPGVFVHAMAMDNLITTHGKPYQNAVSIGGSPVDGNLVQIIAVIPVILILVMDPLAQRLLQAQDRRRPKGRARPYLRILHGARDRESVALPCFRACARRGLGAYAIGGPFGRELGRGGFCFGGARGDAAGRRAGLNLGIFASRGGRHSTIADGGACVR